MKLSTSESRRSATAARVDAYHDVAIAYAREYLTASDPEGRALAMALAALAFDSEEHASKQLTVTVVPVCAD